MFEPLEDLLSISAIFVSSYIPNKTVSLRMFVAMLAFTILMATS